MKVFIFKFFLFLALGLIVGEVIIRNWYLTSEVPQRYLDPHQIQKYIPDQTGYWKGGGHTWHTNKLGWGGTLPSSYNNLITLIGDSFVENFMNPMECHQDVLLKARLPEHNFVEAGRAGVSFIEALEIANTMDSLRPQLHLLYMNASDFTESIKNIAPHSDITQVDLKTQKVIPGAMRSAGLKKILYNWKFAYYLFLRFPLNQIGSSAGQHVPASGEVTRKYDLRMLSPLLDFVKTHYRVDNKIVVFHPDTPKELINAVAAAGFGTIALDSGGDKEWTFVYDHHWTCYGHQRAADQITEALAKQPAPALSK